MTPTTPLASTYASAARTLATQLPPDILAECDRVLGENPSSHERWCMYVVAVGFQDDMDANNFVENEKGENHE